MRVISTGGVTCKSASLQKIIHPSWVSILDPGCYRQSCLCRQEGSLTTVVISPPCPWLQDPGVMWEPPAWELGVWIMNHPKITPMRVSRTRTHCFRAQNQAGNFSSWDFTKSCSLCLSHLSGFEKDLISLSDVCFYKLRSSSQNSKNFLDFKIFCLRSVCFMSDTEFRFDNSTPSISSSHVSTAFNALPKNLFLFTVVQKMLC